MPLLHTTRLSHIAGSLKQKRVTFARSVRASALLILLTSCATPPHGESADASSCDEGRIRVKGECVLEDKMACQKDDVFIDGECRPEPDGI